MEEGTYRPEPHIRSFKLYNGNGGNVGKRHGKPVVLKIYAGRMRDAGHKFYLSQNQVWLTPKVPVEYIEPLNPEQGAESAEGGV